MKVFLRTLVGLCVFGSIFVGAVNAQQPVHIWFSDGHQGPPGDALSVPLIIGNVRASAHLVAFDLEINVDPSVVNWLDIEQAGTAIEDWDLVFANSPSTGRILVSAANSQGTELEVSEDTVLLYFNFQIDAGASLGSCSDLELTSVVLNDGNPSANAFDGEICAAAVIPPSADLSLTQSIDPEVSEAGAVQITLTLENEGPDTATGIEVTDNLPAGLTYQSDDGGGAYTGGVWSIASLVSGTSTTLTINATYDGNGEYTNIAEITASDLGDPDSTPNNGNTEEDDYSEASVRTPAADLSLAVRVDNTAPFVGEPITFSLVLTNDGPDTATDIEVTAPLPSGLTLVSSSLDLRDTRDDLSDAGKRAGTYDNDVWILASLTEYTQATLTIVATSATDDTYTFSGEISAVTQADPDSTPGNGASGEDDMGEAVVAVRAALGAEIVIENADLAGVGLNDTTPVSPVGGNSGTTLGEQRLIALQHAAAIWGSYLISDIPIHISVSYADLDCIELAQTQPTTAGRVPGSSSPLTWYPIALANLLNKSDGNGATSEITMVLNSSPDTGCNGSNPFYYGLDGNGGDHTDLVTVVLGEMARGLGLFSFVNSNTGSKFAGTDDIFSTFLEHTITTKRWSEMSNAERLDSAADIHNMVWQGTIAINAAGDILNGGIHPGGGIRLVASAVEFTNTFQMAFHPFVNPDQLPEEEYRGVNHQPLMALAILNDIGWPKRDLADLSVEMTVDNQAAVPDEQVVFSITLTNDGDSDATGTVVTAQLPGGLTYVSHSGAGSYTPANGLWHAGGLAVGASQTLTLTASVEDLGNKTLTAELTASDQGDPDSSPNNAQSAEDDQVSLTIGAADLSLALSIDTAAPNTGDTVSLTAMVSNDGPDDAPEVIVTNLLAGGAPPLLEYLSDNGGGSYDTLSGEWRVGTLADGGSQSLIITARVNATASFNHSAEITHSALLDPDSTPDNGASGEDDTATVAVNVASADLRIDNAVTNSRPLVGELVDVVFSMTNDGPDTATDMEVQIEASPELTFIDHSGVGAFNSTTGLWTVSSLTNGADAELTLQYRVDGAGTLSVDAELMAVTQPDPDSEPGAGPATEDDTTSAEIITALADLSLQLDVASASANVGEEVTFTYTVTNGGPDGASEIEVTAPLPLGLSYASHTGGSYQANTGVWSISELSANSSTTLSVNAIVNIPGTKTHSAEITAVAEADPDSTPNNGETSEDDQDSVTVGEADLSLTINSSSSSPLVGDEITVTLTITNGGPDNATGVAASLPLPEGLNLVSGDGSYNVLTGIWSPGTVNANLPAQLQLVLSVDSTGTKSLIAQITQSDHEDPDSTPGNSVGSEDDQDSTSLTPIAFQGSTFHIINADPPGVGFNDPTPVDPVGNNPGTTLGEQRLNALQFAADIWGAQLDSDVDIYIQAQFASLRCGSGGTLLAFAGPTTVARDFPGATRENTWYPAALAHSLAGTDINGSTPEVLVYVNAEIDNGCTGRTWYYGLDAGADNTQFDAVSVLLHELAHGLGFYTMIDESGNMFFNLPDIYMTFLENHSTGTNFPDMSSAGRLASLTDTGDIHWTGSLVSGASTILTSGGHNSGHVQMYAPGTYVPGASIFHFSNELEPNNLMEPAYTGAIHNTTLALSAMGDMGWPTEPSSDLSLEQTVSNATPELGDVVTFSLTIRNEGPAQNTGVVVQHDLASTLTVIAVNGTDYNGTTGQWDIGTLDPGEQQTVEIDVRVDAYNRSRSEAEIVAAERRDPDSTPGNGENDEDDFALSVVLAEPAGEADLSLAMTVDEAAPVVSTQVTHTLTVTNDGPDDASSVVVRVELPLGLDFDSASGDGNYLASSSNWNVGSVDAGQSATLDILASVTTTAELTTTAEIILSSEEDPDSTPANNDPVEDDIADVTIQPVSAGVSDLSLVLSASTLTPNVDDTIAINVSLENQGPDTAEDVEVSIALPAGLSYVNHTGDGTWTDDTWMLTNLVSGITANLTITADVDAAGPKVLSAQVTTVLQEDPDSTPGNGAPSEDDQDTITVLPQEADLSLAQTTSQPTATVGETLTFTLTLTNDGPNDAENILVRHGFNAGLTYQSHSGDGTYSSGNGEWQVGDLALGEFASLQIEATVANSGATNSVAEVYEVDQFDPDSTPGNSAAGEDDRANVFVRGTSNAPATIVIANADAAGEGFNDPTPVAPVGGNTATTLGEQRLQAFQYAADIWAQFLMSDITIVVKANFDPLTCSSRGGILGSAAPNSVMRNFPGAPVSDTWYPAALANAIAGDDLNGATAEIRTRFNSSIDNNNNCIYGKNWYYGLDGNSGNNMDLVAVLLHEMAHGLGFASFTNGQTGALFYNMPDIYTSMLEDHSTGLLWSEMTNAQRRNSALDSGDLHWTGPILSSASSVLTNGVGAGGHVEMFAPNPYRPGSSVSHFSTSLAPNELMEPFYTGPNHDPGLAVLLFADLGWGADNDRADLSLGMAVDLPGAGPGEDVSFTLSVTNDGPDDAFGVQVTDLLPAGYSYSDHAASAGTYNANNGLWDIGEILSGETQTLIIDALVEVSADRLNVAEITASDQNDPDSLPANGEPAEDDYAAISVGSADLELTLTVDNEQPTEGDTVSFDLHLLNNGPDAVQGLVHVNLPTGLVYVSSNGPFQANTGLWTPITLNSGGSAGLQIIVTVNAANAAEVIAEVVQSSLPDPDSVPDNGAILEDDLGRVELQPIAVPKADLSLSLTVDDGTPTLNDLLTFNLSVHNDGPNPTGNVAVAFEVDAALVFVAANGNGSYDPVGGVYTVGDLAVAGSSDIDLVFEATATGSLNNRAEISHSNLIDPDSTPGNGVVGEDDFAELTVVPHPPISNTIIILNADAPGEGFNDNTPVAPVGGNSGTTLGQQRLNAFQYAADIWASMLDINVPVVIEARFDPLQCSAGSGVLGAAGPKDVKRDFPGAPLANTWYHAALANNLAGSDLNGATAEISATFNSSIDNNNNCLSGTNWYYGTDANPGGNMDLVAVLLHEFAHGLGFSTFVQGQTGSRFMNYDDIYMTMLENHSTGKLWSQMSNGERAASAVSSSLHWTGPEVVANSAHLTSGRHSSGKVEAFAPNPYQSGSSVSHFSTSLAPNELMEPFYTGPEHNPGLALSLMRDLGWGEGLSADLNLAISVDNASPDFGETIQFTLTVNNDGPDDAPGVVVAAPLPIGLSYASDSGGYDSGSGDWDVGTIASGDSATLTLNAVVATGSATSFSAQVDEVLAVDPDSTPGNDAPAEDDQDAVSIAPTGAGTADLSLNIATVSSQPEVGTQTSFTLTATNNGPDPASGVTVGFFLPPDMPFVSADGNYDSSTSVWSLDPLLSGNSVSLTIIASVEGNVSTTINGEILSSDQDDPDSTPANGNPAEDDHHAVTITPILIPKADLSLSLTTDTGNPILGSRVILTVEVHNDGPDTAEDVTAEVILSGGLTHLSDDGAGSFEGQTWTLGSLAHGQIESLQIEVLVEEATAQTAGAQIFTSSLADPDSAPGNDEPGEDDQDAVDLNPRTGGGATITILNADSPGEGFNDNTPVNPLGGNLGTTLGQQRLIAFQYAADIWSQYLSSDVEIVVRSQFNPLQCSGGGAVLGAAAPESAFRDFPNAPRSNTWYPAALANTLTGTDMNGGTAELHATFNSQLDGACLGSTDWYYGLDGNPGQHIDLVTVLVHEMAHGLGFLTFVNGISGTRFQGYDDAYMALLEDHRTNMRWSQMSNGQRASSALASGNLHWLGSHVAEESTYLTAGRASNGHVDMYAPNPYQSGSSVSHFSRSLSPDPAMEPSYTGPNHDPFLSAQLLYDVGWPDRARADLRTTVVTGSVAPAVGDDVTFTLTVYNDGPAPATGVTLQTHIGDGLVYTSDNGGGAYLSASGVWDIGIVPLDGSVSLEITTTMQASGSKIFGAEVATSELDDPDSEPGNGDVNEDDWGSASVGSADISVDLYVAELEAHEGALVTWSLSVNNEGPDTAHDLTIGFPLPSGTSLVSADAAYQQETATWQIPQLDSGDTALLQVTTRIDTQGAITGMAELINALETDPDSTPNNGDVNEDDQSEDSLEGTAPPIGNLELNIEGFFSHNCPNMSVRFQVLADGTPVNGLDDTAFTLAEDGVPLGFSSIAATNQGEYELNYVTLAPDGQPHTTDLSVSVGSTTEYVTANALNCHVSGIIDISNDTPITGVTGTTGSWYYYRLSVPANQGSLAFAIEGGSGDADLYVKHGAPPTLQVFDYRPLRSGNDELVTIESPDGGDWYVGLHGIADFTDVTLVGKFAPVATNLSLDNVRVSGCPTISLDVSVSRQGTGVAGLTSANFSFSEDNTNLLFSLSELGNGSYHLTYTTPNPDGQFHSLELGLTYEGSVAEVSGDYRYCSTSGYNDLSNWELAAGIGGDANDFIYFRLNVPANQDFLDVAIFGGIGDADLYLRHGSLPTTSLNEESSGRTGNSETIRIENPTSGDWFIGVYGFLDFQNVSLLAGYGQLNPNLTVLGLSSADCPDITIDLYIDNGNGPITGLQAVDFTLSENNGTTFNPTTATETTDGAYRLTYTTENNTGDEVFVLILADDTGVLGQANASYDNCARDGGIIPVWVNGGYQALAGSSFGVQINTADVDPAFNINQLQFALAYDPSVLTYTGFNAAGSLIEDWGLMDGSTSTTGEVIFSAGALTAGPLQSNGDSILITLLFEVDSNATAETCSTLELDQAGFIFNDGQPTALSTSGQFCVPAGTCPRATGDINGDGNPASGFDAFLILNMIEGTATPYDPIPLCVADTNCSGDVALMDAVTVLQRAVGFIDDYCLPNVSSTQGAQSNFTIDIPTHQLDLPLGEPFSLDIDISQFADPVYGYRFELTYDPSLISLDTLVVSTDTLSSRWQDAKVTASAGSLIVTHLSPTAPATGDGTLLRLTGNASNVNQGTSSLDFQSFALAANSEPQTSQSFVIEVSGTPCFDQQAYDNALDNWPTTKITDVITILDCLE